METVTCASFGKNRDKHFRTPLGEFQYLYLPQDAYPYGLRLEKDGKASYLIASPEKALCDSVYKIRGVQSIADLRSLLFEDWRMEEGEIRLLDHEFIQWLAPRYGRRSVTALAAWISKGVSQ